MDFGLEQKHLDFLAEFRAYLAVVEDDPSLDLDAVRADFEADPKAPRASAKAFVRRLGQDGWLGIGTPKEFGGLGLGFVEQWLFLEELKYNNLPSGQLLIQSIIPALVFLASDAIRGRFLPRCLSGELTVAIGYSEPGAGSDLASLQTRATPTEGGWLINGQKIWTTNAQNATHLWLATRTGAPDSKHRGITMFILDMASPGITVAPIITQGGERTNHVYFSDVFVPDADRLSNVDEGWKLIMGQLAFERLFTTAEMRKEFHGYLKWWHEHPPGDAAEREWQLRELARMAADMEAARLMTARSAWMMAEGMVPVVEASMLKFFYSTAHQRNSIDAVRLAGALGQLSYGEPDAPGLGRMERAWRGTPAYTFGAGANELQRDIVAERGLGLARNRKAGGLA